MCWSVNRLVCLSFSLSVRPSVMLLLFGLLGVTYAVYTALFSTALAPWRRTKMMKHRETRTHRDTHTHRHTQRRTFTQTDLNFFSLQVLSWSTLYSREWRKLVELTQRWNAWDLQHENQEDDGEQRTRCKYNNAEYTVMSVSLKTSGCTKGPIYGHTVL